jgi:predicted phage terminase large subunit-like protein
MTQPSTARYAGSLVCPLAILWVGFRPWAWLGPTALPAVHLLPARDETPESLIDWGRRFLPDYFQKPPSRMHVWLDAELSTLHLKRASRLNVIGPRGSAKSTLASLAWPLQSALEAREPYIWIISDTRAQAAAHLENLRAEVEDNDDLRQAYPRALEGTLACRASRIVLANGVAIEAFGTGQRIRGRRFRSHRPTLIICDDLQNERHLYSKHLRAASRQWFHGALIKAGTPQTNFVHLATALHRDALAMELMRTPGWTTRTFKAIERWPDNAHLWAQWQALYTDPDRPDAIEAARRFFDEHRADMEAGAELLWPEHEDLYTLMCLRIEGGRAAFEREKQSQPADSETCVFPAEYFASPDLWFDEWPKDLVERTMALDPGGSSSNDQGDFSAFVLVGQTGNRVVWVEADLIRAPVMQVVRRGVELYCSFQPDRFAVEENQLKGVFGELFAEELDRQYVAVYAVEPTYNSAAKVARISRIAPWFERKAIRFKNRSSSTRLLVEQLRAFPFGDHDDGPDALEMALRLLQEPNPNSSPPTDGIGNRLRTL